MSGGVGAGPGPERDGRAIDARALIEFGRNRLLYSLVLSRQVVIRKTSLARRRGDRSGGGRFFCLLTMRQKVKESEALVGEKPGAQTATPRLQYGLKHCQHHFVLLKHGNNVTYSAAFMGKKGVAGG